MKPLLLCELLECRHRRAQKSQWLFERSVSFEPGETTMKLYDKYILPKVVHFTCGMKPMMLQREKVVHRAEGRVLEIGIGSGLNLPFYDAERVEKVIGLDPSVEMNRMARRTADQVVVDVEFLECRGEDIPLDDCSVDSILMTYTLCTIPDAQRALNQMIRVLRPGGRLIFCEHGAAPDASVRRWQDRLNPLWGRLGGGCNLNRDVPELIAQGGFRIDELDTMYLPGWRPASFNYWGTAAPVQSDEFLRRSTIGRDRPA